MNKTAQTELHRLFIIERLPEPLTTASSHLQVIDNYIPQTRLRLRQLRDPYTNTKTRVLQQVFPAADNDQSTTKLAEIYLDENEYALFRRYEGQELRKNRYFHEFEGLSVSFDIYLGQLEGLATARIDFATRETMERFEPPAFAIYEITSDAFFTGRNLVTKGFTDVRAEIVRLGSLAPTVAELLTE